MLTGWLTAISASIMQLYVKVQRSALYIVILKKVLILANLII